MSHLVRLVHLQGRGIRLKTKAKTALDLRVAVHEKLKLEHCTADELLLSLTKDISTQTIGQVRATSPPVTITDASLLGMKRGGWLYVCYPARPAPPSAPVPVSSKLSEPDDAKTHPTPAKTAEPAAIDAAAATKSAPVYEKEDEFLAAAKEKGFASVEEWKSDLLERQVVYVKAAGPDGEVVKQWELPQTATCEQLLHDLCDVFHVVSPERLLVARKGGRESELRVFHKFPKMRITQSYPGPDLQRNDSLVVSLVADGATYADRLGIATNEESVAAKGPEKLQEGLITADDIFAQKKAHEKIGTETATVQGVLYRSQSAFQFHFSHSRRRMGWLYGKVIHDHADSAEVGWVKVEAVYEPPQFGFQHRIVELEDPERPRVDLLMKQLGYDIVGWIFSHPYRHPQKNDQHNQNQNVTSARDILGDRDWREGKNAPLQATELLRSAELQGKYGQYFVTLVLTQDKLPESKDEFLALDAWQVSKQCVRLHQRGQLRPLPGRPFVLHSTVPVRLHEKGTAQEILTNEIDAHYFAAYTRIREGFPCFKDTGGFPVANRRGIEGNELRLDFDQAKNLIMQPTVHDDFLEKLSELNTLLFISRRRKHFGLTDSEVDELVRAVADEDADTCELFRSKIEARLGLAFRCPVCQAKGILTGGYSAAALKKHVNHGHKNDLTPVVCPLASLRSHGAKSLRCRVSPPYWKHLENLLGNHGEPPEAKESRCREDWDNWDPRTEAKVADAAAAAAAAANALPASKDAREENDDVEEEDVSPSSDMDLSDDGSDAVVASKAEDDGRDTSLDAAIALSLAETDRQRSSLGAATSGANQFCWEFEDGDRGSGSWREFKACDTKSLEKKLAKGETTAILIHGSGVYSIQWDSSRGSAVTGIQRNTSSRFERRVRRVRKTMSGSATAAAFPRVPPAASSSVDSAMRMRTSAALQGNNGRRPDPMASGLPVPPAATPIPADHSSSRMTPRQEAATTLLTMGYEEDVANLALDRTGNDIAEAVKLCSEVLSLKPSVTGDTSDATLFRCIVATSDLRKARELAAQLVQLRSMGILTDDEKNISVLKANGFDLAVALNHLLG